ncbi:ATP-dependent Clp protease ATP-binding subunit CLPT2, chloroplastic isoform X2 [Rosa chinensis]|uniref:ATP-dependent Clp protease ATP-binding subunit CLPT2, chloroplastic isoform X2 n=1 Tax=Rosa chinensis TaxID=74649 RepID=UPI000D08808D|nr:ATP-dependent Clp protease ATP-binding subunit CLPT2, chloroplastic isoform X2 [Rosa chinensis]
MARNQQYVSESEPNCQSSDLSLPQSASASRPQSRREFRPMRKCPRTTLASKFLRANGLTVFKVREETIKLLGKADMYFFSPEHPALTDEAQRVLDWAVDKKIKSGGSGEITTSHLLLGIWYEVDSPGHKIMASLGFNEEKVKELESLISDG